MTRLRGEPTGLVAVAVVTAIVPLFLGSTGLLVYISLLLAATVTTGVSMLMGYAGQVSLGQAGFYAVGAYTSALLPMHGVPRLAALAAAPLIAAALGVLVGVPLLRLRGHYLAFATLAFQLILLALLGQQSFLGGDIGLSGLPQLGIGSYSLSGFRPYAWVAWGALVVVTLLTRNIVSSRPGRGLRALATSEVAAASSGVPVGRYKLVVFALAAAFAGLAGGIYTFVQAYVAPSSFGVLLSFEFVVMAVVGGLGTVWGPLVGSAVITVLLQWLNGLGTQPGMPVYAPQVFSYAVYAGLLVVMMLFLPDGLVPAGGRLVRFATRWRRPQAPAERPTAAEPLGADAPPPRQML